MPAPPRACAPLAAAIALSPVPPPFALVAPLSRAPPSVSVVTMIKLSRARLHRARLHRASLHLASLHRSASQSCAKSNLAISKSHAELSPCHMKRRIHRAI